MNFISLVIFKGQGVQQVLRYLVSGATGFLTNISIYLLLLKVFDINYVLSSVLAFSAGVAVSFVMQKFFTFQNRTAGKTGVQLFKHILLLSFNLGANVFIIILLVEWVNISEIISQIATNIIIAMWSFFIYRRVIFS